MEKIQNPKISVIMATHNTPKLWLHEAISSILKQSYKDFEFIIIDDASTENQREIILEYKDPRIIFIRNNVNLGLTKSLNLGLKIAKGKYIARMDSDDISQIDRFEKQLNFMENNTQYAVVGSYRRAFGVENKLEKWNLPKTRDEQQVQLFFFNCGITHPTAFIRKSVLLDNQLTYNESYLKAQDYGLWVDITKYGKMHMYPEVLLLYRKHENQISRKGNQSQREYAKTIKIDQLNKIGLDPSGFEIKLHFKFLNNEVIEPNQTYLWIEKLINANKKSNYFSHDVFCNELNYRWYKICSIKKTERKFQPYYKDSFTVRYFLKELKYYFNTFLMNVLKKIM